MIIPTYFPVMGGAQVQVRQISAALSGEAWRVRVLTRRHSYAHPRGLPAEAQVAGVPVIRLYSRGLWKSGSLLYMAGGLWYLLRTGRGQIYHAHDTGAAGWLAVAARYLLGGRCLVKLRTGRGPYERSLGSTLARWQLLTLLRLADRVVVVNREVESFVLELGIPPGRVVCIPNGVDPLRFYPASAQVKLAARRKLGLPAGELLALYVGRLEYMKGVDLLVQAWAALPAGVQGQARLLLVGDGPERLRLERQAAQAGVTGRVLFLGEQAEVETYYQAADLFVLPSRTEGLSNAMMEAMASGLPVLATRVGGARDLLVHECNGLLCEPEDSAALSMELSRLICDPHLRQAFGGRARSSALDYASLPVVVERLQGVYRRLLAEQAAG